MNILNGIKLLPTGWPHLPKRAFERKMIVESVIEEVLNQINSENRNPTIWECDCINNAMGSVLFGSYTLAANNALSCFTPKNEVSKPAEWWIETEEYSTETLKSCLEQVKGYPPRVDY